MKVLIVTGSTIVPIDRVRCLSNIFRGRTGTEISYEFLNRKHNVTILTSNEDLIERDFLRKYDGLFKFKTYDDLYLQMEYLVKNSYFNVILFGPAVSDYRVTGTFNRNIYGEFERIDSSKKMSSKIDDLYLHLEPTLKIIDLIRSEWNYQNILVKFKLEVGLEDCELVPILKHSIKQSKADIIVGNCLEWMKEKASEME